MKFNYKSRKGFTLIELLVVIGILAVLAAIAIPSVAGIIDRTNVSADKTNTSEYTNAIERFASEYELYCQDIASGTLKVNNLDSAQGRVYNITKATSRLDISNIEVEPSDIVSNDQIAIYRDTKYPANAKTAQLIVQNYTKTSSSTFEPKQSDMNYWYSPDCGVVVVAEPDKTADELDKLVVSGKDAKGNDLNEIDAKWINLTTGEILIITAHNNKIPEGGTYYVGVTVHKLGDYTGAKEILRAGDNFPETSGEGDVYVYGDYEYRYRRYSANSTDWFGFDGLGNEGRKTIGWGARAINLNKTRYNPLLEEINNVPLKNIMSLYRDCKNLTTNGVPTLPTSINRWTDVFYNCDSLTVAPQIPNHVKYLSWTFVGCDSLEVAPQIPEGVTDIRYMFQGCKKLKTYSGSNDAIGDFSNYKLPNGISSLEYTFHECASMTHAPKIPNNVTDLDLCFMRCTSLKVAPEIPQSVKSVHWAFTESKTIETTIKLPCGITGNTSSVFISWPSYEFYHIDSCDGTCGR